MTHGAGEEGLGGLGDSIAEGGKEEEDCEGHVVGAAADGS